MTLPLPADPDAARATMLIASSLVLERVCAREDPEATRNMALTFHGVPAAFAAGRSADHVAKTIEERAARHGVTKTAKALSIRAERATRPENRDD